jgi:hypothetical protein
MKCFINNIMNEHFLCKILYKIQKTILEFDNVLEMNAGFFLFFFEK